MRIVRINAWKKGLVMKNNQLVRVVGEGVYIAWPNYEIYEYDMAQPFKSTIHLDILLQNADFVKAIHLIEVKKNELVLQYENGILKSVLESGRYVFWKGLMNYSFTTIDTGIVEINSDFDRTLLASKELTPFLRTLVVEPNELAVLYVDSKYSKILESGTYYFWRTTVPVQISRVDLRTLQMEVSGQEILTKDKASVRVSFYAQYNVIDVVKALVKTKEYDKQMYVLMQLALREYIGTLTLDELLDKKETVVENMLSNISERLTELGVAMKTCGIRDIILPGDMKEIMNQVLVAEKKAQANTIIRREETAAVRTMLNTAKLMEDNPMLYKLKEMEYVEKIAEKISTISLSNGGQITEQLKQLFINKSE